MTTLILNRESITPGKRSWHQIEVSGEGLTSDGRIQVTDAESLKSIVRNFEIETEADLIWPGLLVDHDHLSHDPTHSTEAMGWLKDVEIRNDDQGTPQLWSEIDWTDLGAAGIQNKRWKFFSTEYGSQLEDLGKGRVRPLALDGLSLTNRPQRKGGKPISNREADAEHNQPKKNMKKVTDALGLAEDASEDDIVAAVTALVEKADKADKADKIELEMEADKVLNRHAAKIPEGSRDEWRAGLIANRAAVIQREQGVQRTLPRMVRTQNAISFEGWNFLSYPLERDAVL